jgi:hypothetical protein
MNEDRGKRGRPRKFAAGERTRGTLTVRLRDEVRSHLEAAAAAAGRSLSEEIEHRLELAFGHRDLLRETWGHHVFNIAEAAAKSLKHIQRHTGWSWVQDDRTCELFIKTLEELVRRYRQQAVLALVDEPIEAQSDPDLVDTFASLGGIPAEYGPRTFAEVRARRDAEDARDEVEPPAGGAEEEKSK